MIAVDAPFISAQTTHSTNVYCFIHDITSQKLHAGSSLPLRKHSPFKKWIFQGQLFFKMETPFFLHLQSIERKILRSDTYPSQRSIVTFKVN